MDEKDAEARPVMGTIFSSCWRASETLSGLFNRESRYIIVRMSHLPFDP